MFRNIIKTIVLLIILQGILFASGKKVLVEIFTNSHCVLCPAAHSTMNSYLQTANASNVEYIYYHMPFPYSDDLLNQQSSADASAKNQYYGPNSSTPKAYFNGTLVSNSYGSWQGKLDELVAEESNFELVLSGSFTDNDFTINATLTQTGNSSVSDFSINYVVIEDVNYLGRNGISDQKHVMRKIVNAQGDPFSINLNQTKNFETTIVKNSLWNTNNLKIVVFIQSNGSKEVFQSESIAYSDFTVTDINNEHALSNNYKLEQNYPNPFNPTTTISYTIPSSPVTASSEATWQSDQNASINSSTGNNVSGITSVQLKVYDIIGREVATLVDQKQNPGKYSVRFDATNLSGGIYFFQLRSNNLIETKKMQLLK